MITIKFNLKKKKITYFPKENNYLHGKETVTLSMQLAYFRPLHKVMEVRLAAFYSNNTHSGFLHAFSV